MNKLSNPVQASNRKLIRTVQYPKQPQLFLHNLSKSKSRVSFSKDPESLHLGTINHLQSSPDNIYEPIPTSTGITRDDFTITTANFKQNDDFLTLLQKIIKYNVHNDFTYKLDSLNFQNSYMPIYDLKKLPNYMNQKPDLDNVFGYMLIDGDGQMIEGSYEVNHMYRLCNTDGVVTLSEYLLEEVKKNI